MPTSKKRKPPRPVSDKPAPLHSPEKALELATLALTEASLNIVREAEIQVTLAVRGRDQDRLDDALETHLLLRSASLGLLTAYRRLAGLPDPRDPYITEEN